MKKRIEEIIKKKQREAVLKILKDNAGYIIAAFLVIIIYSILKKLLKDLIRETIKASIESGAKYLWDRKRNPLDDTSSEEDYDYEED